MTEPTIELTLERFCSSEQMGTFGTISVGGATLYTLEPPWRNNEPRVSCIPAGRYRCSRRRYFRGGYDSWELQDVEGRSHILIHKGNIHTHSNGCVLLGSSLGFLGGMWAVMGSGNAFEFFSEQMKEREFWLTIKDCGHLSRPVPAPSSKAKENAA